MRKSEDVHRELFAARDDARQMSIALRSVADALDELGPAPEHVPAQDELKRTLTRLSDAKHSSSMPGFRRRRAFAAPLRPESRADSDSPSQPTGDDDAYASLASL